MKHWLDQPYTAESLQQCMHLIRTEDRAAALSKIEAIYMGYDNSWSYAKYLAGEVGTASTTTAGLVPKEKVCQCESHYLFCWGHEKQCDYYEGEK